MHFVHSVFCTNRPFSITLTRCKFGRNLRFVAFIEKLRLCPNMVVLPHVAHFAMLEKILSPEWDQVHEMIPHVNSAFNRSVEIRR